MIRKSAEIPRKRTIKTQYKSNKNSSAWINYKILHDVIDLDKNKKYQMSSAIHEYSNKVLVDPNTGHVLTRERILLGFYYKVHVHELVLAKRNEVSLVLVHCGVYMH